MNLSWVYYVFVALPETTASAIFALAFLKQPFAWRNIAKIGIIYGTIAFIVRHLPISFGVHSVILITIFAVLLTYFTKSKPTSALLASLLNMIVLGLGEIISGLVLMKLFNITYEYVRANDWLLVIFVFPQVIILISLALIIKRYLALAERKSKNEISQ